MKYMIIGVIIVALLLVQIPFLYLSVYFHELSHKVDYRNIDKIDEDFCVLNNCNGKAGNYKFSAIGQENEINKISQYTEIKALTTSTLIMLGYILLVILIVLYIIKNDRFKKRVLQTKI